jgi:hypothetical protein
VYFVLDESEFILYRGFHQNGIYEGNETMTAYAAYDDLSIYAVASTRTAAIQKARDDAKEPEAKFKTAQVSDEFAAQIERDGWDGNRQSFEIDRMGYIVETTDW